MCKIIFLVLSDYCYPLNFYSVELLVVSSYEQWLNLICAFKEIVIKLSVVLLYVLDFHHINTKCS